MINSFIDTAALAGSASQVGAGRPSATLERRLAASAQTRDAARSPRDVPRLPAPESLRAMVALASCGGPHDEPALDAGERRMLVCAAVAWSLDAVRRAAASTASLPPQRPAQVEAVLGAAEHLIAHRLRHPVVVSPAQVMDTLRGALSDAGFWRHSVHLAAAGAARGLAEALHEAASTVAADIDAQGAFVAGAVFALAVRATRPAPGLCAAWVDETRGRLIAEAVNEFEAFLEARRVHRPDSGTDGEPPLTARCGNRLREWVGAAGYCPGLIDLSVSS